jgi:hypothetical protein
MCTAIDVTGACGSFVQKMSRGVSAGSRGFCPTRNTNQPLFILRHILTTAKKEKLKVYTAFLDLFAAYDHVPREKLWRYLRKNKTPQYLRDIIQTMYTGCLYLLINGDEISEEAPKQRLKTGLPSKSPSVLPL